jgi:hypothetical protein
MANFSEILNKPASSIEPPKPLPPGTYLCLVDGQPEFQKIGKNSTDCVNFKMKPVQAQADVDQTALQEVLTSKDGTFRPLQDTKIFHRLFITEDSIWRLKKFLVEDLGIEEGSKSLGQLIPEAMGRQVLVNVGHRPSDDGTQIYIDIKGTAAV